MFPWTNYKNSLPSFIADHNSVTRGSGRQIDWTRVPPTYRAGTSYTITTTGAIATAATVPVAALPVALPVGTVLDFTGTGKFAKLTAPAAVGATSLAVEALDAALISGNTATYIVSLSRLKVIPAGTIMALLSGGKVIPRAAVTGSETSICLLASNAIEDAPEDAISGYGDILGGVIYDNLLPDYGNGSLATWKGELQAAGVGTGFAWQTYADTRAA